MAEPSRRLIAAPVLASLLLFGAIGIATEHFHPSFLSALPHRFFGIISNDLLLAIPFFTFMGAVLERFGLADRAKDKLTELSLGNQQRVQVIAALLGEPVALVLDEPFSGLDPVAVDAMAAILSEVTSTGVPVLFSSHQLDLVERLCDDLVILSHGRIVAQGSTDELRRSGPERHRLVATSDVDWVHGLAGVKVVEQQGARAILEFTDPAARDRVVAEALSHGGLEEFAAIVPTVAEIYRGVAS